MKVQFIRFVFVGCLLIFQHVQAYEFNSEKVINTSGSKSVLSEDEGYLFLSFTTNSDISRITLDGEGIGNKIRFNDVKRGENHALIKLKAGKYAWENIHIYVGIGSFRYKVDEKKYSFEVKSGVVNYPGTWQFQGEWAYNSRAILGLQNYNLLSYEMFHFEKHYNHLIAKLPFQYQGKIKDPYADFLTKAINKLPKETALPNLYFRQDEPLKNPMTVYKKDTSTASQTEEYPKLDQYIQNDVQTVNAVSPNGRYMLFSSAVNDLITLGLIGVKNLDTFLLYQQKLPVSSSVSTLEWIDKDSFFLTLSNKGVDKSYVAHLTIEEQSNSISAKFIQFRKEGYLLNGLIKENNQLLFVASHEAGKNINNTLYKVDVTNEKSISESFRKIYKSTKKLKNVVDWLVDRNGDVRAAITAKYNKKEESTTFEYWFLADVNSQEWKNIKSTSDIDSVFWLKAISQDEKYFLVLTNEFSDYKAIHKFSTSDGSHMGLYYENPEHDIEDILVNHNDQSVTGYTFIENGSIQSKYLVELEEELIKAKHVNADMELFQVANMKQQKRMLLFGLKPNTKGAWFVMDTESGVTEKLFDVSPRYEQLPKGIFHSVKVPTIDGLEIEGFLVLPNSQHEDGYPLVVMPHGGPIGARDYAHNNEMQHFLASQGIASLKVNFRGSGGYGKAFRELGKQQWGEKIEEDIFTVTQHVIRTHSINEGKICSMGGSYGGYSALMLAYLYPDTFRCAISYAGVMDLPLLFTSKDLSRDKAFQDELAEIVGNPINEIEKLVKKSPLYLLNKIKTPVLIAQGVNDERVRVEHALRMQQMISVYGLNHQVILFEDEKHAITQNNTMILYVHQALEFIKNNLKL